MGRRKDFQAFHGSPEECRGCNEPATERNHPITGKRIADHEPGWCTACRERLVREAGKAASGEEWR